MINKTILNAYKILQGEELSYQEALELAKLEGENLLDLISLARKVTKKFSGPNHICTIMNAKSGSCVENCKFCSQSAFHKTKIPKYPLVSEENILKKAAETFETGVKHFGLVTSGRGYFDPKDPEFLEIVSSIDKIKKIYPSLDVCASIGLLSEETAKVLADHKIGHYNLNIQTAPAKYDSLVSTSHSIEAKIKTVKYLTKYGVKVCCGGILGLGETMEDRIEMAFAIKELEIDSIPLNVLIPIGGTPLENQKPLSIAEIAKSFALFRLINPKTIIKFAAGRETKLKDFQALLMLSGANGFLTGGYLTTKGRSVEEDQQFERELNLF